MTKTEHHRTTLACMAGGSTLAFSSIRDAFHVYLLQLVALEMVRVRVTFLLHNVAISGSCMFQVLNGPHVGPLLFHMSVFNWHTCRVTVGSRVTSSLDRVSYFYWSTWPSQIWPRVKVLSVHVSFFYQATWLDGFLLGVGFLLAHVSCHGYFTCHAMVHPHVAFYLIMWPAQVLPCAQQSIHHKSNSRSSLLHRLTI